LAGIDNLIEQRQGKKVDIHSMVYAAVPGYDFILTYRNRLRITNPKAAVLKIHIIHNAII